MNINKEAILNPRMKLEEVKPFLFEIYQKDYAQVDTQELDKRWNDTIFMTEVLPHEEKEYIRKYGRECYPTGRLLESQVEDINYQRENKKIQKEVEEEFAEFMKKNFKVPEDASSSALWDLDFEAFSMFSEDHKRQKDYAFACLDLEMSPISDENEIETILRKKEALKEKRNIARIQRTKWGKRIQETYPMFSAEVLASIFFDDETSASTGKARCKNGEIKTFSYIPLMRYAGVPSLDRMVLHELRHVIEATDEKTGLSVYRMPRFDMINEIRTERNALKDVLQVPMMFSRNSGEIQSYYELLMPSIPELNDLEDSLNYAAFQPDRGMVEVVFGKELVSLMDIVNEEEKVIQKIRKG